MAAGIRRKLIVALFCGSASLGACGYPSDVAPFCDVAVPVFEDGSAVRPELENLKRLAVEYLPPESSEPLVVELDLLWAALQGGSNEGYSTGPVAELIGDICDARVRAMISGKPLVIEGQDPTPPMGR